MVHITEDPIQNHCPNQPLKIRCLKARSQEMIWSSRHVAFFLLGASIASQAAIPLSEISRKKAAGLSLIELSPDAEPVWMTQEEKHRLILSHKNFVSLCHAIILDFTESTHSSM